MKDNMTGFANQPFPIIDMHAHILPGVDDGSRTMEETIAMLCSAAEQGIVGVVATPHYLGRGTPPSVKRRAAEVREAIRDILPGFQVFEGCENYYREALPEQLETGHALTLSGSRYVLVEFDTEISFDPLYRGLRRLTESGSRPVLAHMERYGCLRDESRLEEIMRLRCMLQMNFDSLKGNVFSKEARWCRRQVLEGRISLFGTDMHRTDFRPPDIKEPVRWLRRHVDAEDLRRMLYENPMCILRGSHMSDGKPKTVEASART